MTTSPRVIVIGAGPAALAAAHRLRTEPDVRVTLVAPEGVSGYLAGTLPVATGDATVDDHRTRVDLDGVEVIPAPVDAIEPSGVRVEGASMEAQAVIAAPGLALVDTPISNRDGGGAAADTRIVSFWDLDGAATAAPVIGAFERGVITVVIASALYRCPPAPYGLAMRLAARAKRLGLPVKVRLTTPEPRPLAAIGSQVGEFLQSACAVSGVEIDHDFQPDAEALGVGEIRDSTGARLDTDLAVVIPPHRAHALLAEMAGEQPLVTVDDQGRSPHSGVYVAGDAVASPFPRASAPAVVSGIAAAEGTLEDLGFDVTAAAALPEPDCFVDRGAGAYSRIRITYPDGTPPAGSPDVEISGPEPAESGGFDAARDQWRATATESP